MLYLLVAMGLGCADPPDVLLGCVEDEDTATRDTMCYVEAGASACDAGVEEVPEEIADLTAPEWSYFCSGWCDAGCSGTDAPTDPDHCYCVRDV